MKNRGKLQSTPKFDVLDKTLGISQNQQRLIFRTSRRSKLCLACLVVICLKFYTFSSSFDQHVQVATTGTFAIVMATKCERLIERSLLHYLSCSSTTSLTQIFVVGPRKTPSSSLAPSPSSVPIFFTNENSTSLNDRFKPLPPNHLHASTTGLFSVDDDILVSCKSLQYAFQTWESGKNNSLVGFFPRLHLYKSQSWLSYKGWPSVYWSNSYSMILTKACFIHKDYFSLYSSTENLKIREIVDEMRNCEDIAMNVLVRSSFYVQGHVKDYGVLSGISASHAYTHMSSRASCLKRFAAIFPNRLPDLQPLQTSFPSTPFEWITLDFL